jgi:hypothetical protein
MSKIILMLVIGWVPQMSGWPPQADLKEAWRFEREITVENCLIMNRLVSGGAYGIVTVRCGEAP